MGKFCSKCGTKVEGTFCTNCGTKVDEKVQSVNSEVNDYLMDKVNSKRNHDIYRLIVGIVMIVLGSIFFIASFSDDIMEEYLLYDINLVFRLPGIALLAGGILSVVSRKNNNKLLLISGICYVAAAICNACGIEDISIAFILCCIFAPLNFVFYSKTNKYEQK